MLSSSPPDLVVISLADGSAGIRRARSNGTAAAGGTRYFMTGSG